VSTARAEGLGTVLADSAPLLRRAAGLDPAGLVRVRTDGERVSTLVRLPFDVFAGRTIAAAAVPDGTYRVGEVVAWLDGAAGPPGRCDAQWRWPFPPATGWRRLDTVPADVVDRLVGAGARTLADVGAQAGAAAMAVRPQATQALLDSVVLSVEDAGSPDVPVTLRALSAVRRMAFLPAGSALAVDVRGRWIRLAARFGSVYAERPGTGLSLAG
jgi:hypothetical protein